MGFKQRGVKRVAVGPVGDLGVENPNAAGIDIGAKSIWVSVPEGRVKQPVREFTTFTTALNELADWLKECAVDTVAMESTGVYWVPLYEILEDRGIDVQLVNAHHVKSVPGRKSDVLDCQWLGQLHRFGLLRGSFRPAAEIVELRTYLRQRDTLVRVAADEVRRMQKALTLMNLQLHNVISDITGETGIKILRAIVAGERDPAVLASYRHYRTRASRETIEAALTGNYQPEHIFSLRQSLTLYDTHQRLIAECDDAVASRLDALNAAIDAAREPLPKRPQRRSSTKYRYLDFRARLYQLTGVDLTAVPGLSDYSAATLVSEIGTDMSRWPNAKAFTAWLRLSPRADITGGKTKSRRTLPNTSRAAQILRMAALNAGRTDTAIGAFYRRLAIRKPPGIAVVATASKLARIIYTLLKNQAPFNDIGVAAYNQRQRTRRVRNLERQAKALGLTLVKPAA
jgi:transposase